MAENTQGVAVLPRDGYPVGVPCWIDTSQRDLGCGAKDFYGGLFGWEFQEWPSGRYLVASLDGLDVAGIALQPDDEPSWNTYIQVDSAEWATADALQLGGKVLVQPFDVADAGRMSVIADPMGAVFCMWEPKGHNGAQLVNAAGSWNWSDLYTPDPSLTEPFYRSLFGWDAAPVQFGEITATMWRRPGYGDALEKRDPGIRERHEKAGAPEGFTDAVAWLMQSDGPARWHVTLSVDDTDASVARAAELGAEVRRGAVRRRAGADRAAQGPAGRRVHDQPVRRRLGSEREAHGAVAQQRARVVLREREAVEPEPLGRLVPAVERVVAGAGVAVGGEAPDELLAQQPHGPRVGGRAVAAEQRGGVDLQQGAAGGERAQAAVRAVDHGGALRVGEQDAVAVLPQPLGGPHDVVVEARERALEQQPAAAVRALGDQLEVVGAEPQRVLVRELAAAVQPHADPALIERALRLLAELRQPRDLHAREVEPLDVRRARDVMDAGRLEPACVRDRVVHPRRAVVEPGQQVAVKVDVCHHH